MPFWNEFKRPRHTYTHKEGKMEKKQCMTSARGLEPRVLILRNIKVISNFLLCGRADIMKPLLRNVALPSWVTYPQMNHIAAKWMHRRNTL